MIYINFDKSSGEPLYIQAFTQLADKINHGEIEPGSKLPSQRQMARDMSVSVNTITNAYNMLAQYGYVSAAERSGYFVKSAEKTADVPDRLWRSNVPYVYNFSRNGTDLSIPSAFRRAYKQTARLDESKFTYPDYNGDYDLRKQISYMLNKTQGIKASPVQIIIGTDITRLLDCLMRVIGSEAVFGLENPAYNKIAQFMNLGAHKVNYLNIPESGISAETLKNFDADVLFLMPFHHYPLYYKTDHEQKRAVLDWAGDERYIIEYNYDMDFVYSNPSEPLFSMTENKNVIFAGDFTRTVSPSLSAAYMVLPEFMLAKWKRVFYTYHSCVGRQDQAFITEIIRDGSYYSNINRLRRIYKKKRDLLIGAIKRHPFGKNIEILNAECGTTLLLRPLIDADEEFLIDIAHQNGVKLSFIKNALEKPNPIISDRLFILGFGELSDEDIVLGANKLLDIWSSI